MAANLGFSIKIVACRFIFAGLSNYLILLFRNVNKESLVRTRYIFIGLIENSKLKPQMHTLREGNKIRQTRRKEKKT